MKNVDCPLIEDVNLCELQTHSDERGSLTEIFRAAWSEAPALVQWNFVRTRAGVLRGLHGHLVHTDYLILLQGAASIGLKDLRTGSPTENGAAVVALDDQKPRSLTIPPGVAHGFYFHRDSLIVYGVTAYWSKEDELGCRWDDPGLGIEWPVQSAEISERDARLPTLEVFRAQMREVSYSRRANWRTVVMASTI